MTQQQIQQLFQLRYNQNNWKQFLSQAFIDARLLSSPDVLTGVNTDVATQVMRLGYIALNENGIERTIAIYDVTLAPGIILERNRVGLRNLLRKYWKDIDAAFIVYHRPENPNWRFTYVSELTGFDAEGELIKVKTEPKRYTYILGEGESCRTAAERFAIIAKKGNKTTLDDVKEAFSVEKLSKSFFDEYKKHYELFCDYMVSKPNIRQAIFSGDEKAIRDFNKKLLGRIVFLYFIQKKGWLGVPERSKWGQGDPNFLSNLFNNARNRGLFYSEYLARLFFDTLNTPRPNDIIELIKGEPVKIPFLNGGLFEEDNKIYRNLILPAEFFENLFLFFNQYNFTIYEDDPNDHTVAVDPEMLGHIFENLLEDNKDKGAFYTPKEIVHYMCQESLKEYLKTYLQGKQQWPDDEAEGQHMEESLQLFVKKKEAGGVIDFDESLATALRNVKICDPAIGSGAFPMGLLNEIFQCMYVLYYASPDIVGDVWGMDTWQPHLVKANIIQNSIYGVDIEKGAVDIARLRFWLSLIVDEPEPTALPNLDYKIVVGNSLVSKLGDDIIDIDWELNETSYGLFGTELAEEKANLLKKISSEQKEYFNPNSDKKKLAADIRQLKIDLLINQLGLMINEQNIQSEPKAEYYRHKPKAKFVTDTNRYYQTLGWKQQIEKLKILKGKPDEPLHFFDWKLDFPEVMNRSVADKIGFDVVIANPPYIGEKGNKEKFRDVKKTKLEPFYLRKMDYFYFFFHQALNITNKDAFISFITTNYYVTATGATKLRRDLKERASIYKLINFGESKVFSTALGQHNLITFLTKKEDIEFCDVISVNKNGLIDSIAFEAIFNKYDNETSYSKIAFADLYESDENYIRIVTTGNKIEDDLTNIILNKISQKGVALGSICEVNQGLRTGADKVSPSHIRKYGEHNKYSVGEGIFFLTVQEIDALLLNNFEKTKIKQLFKNSDISKYVLNEATNLRLIDLFYPNDRNLDLQRIPNIIAHLTKYESILKGRKENANGIDKAIARGDYYYGSVRRKLDFALPKIVAPQRSKSNVFAYTEIEWFASADVYYITDTAGKQDLKYILGLLNSKLYLQWLLHRGKTKGAMLELYQKPLSEIPINVNANTELISKIVDDIIRCKNQNKSTIDLETEIDNLVYKLYELTYDEVLIIEPEFSERMSREEYEKLEI